MLTVIGFPLLILNRMNLLVAVLFLTQANGSLSTADEKPESAAVLLIALKGTVNTYIMERLRQSGEFVSECSRTIFQQARAALLSSQNPESRVLFVGSLINSTILLAASCLFVATGISTHSTATLSRRFLPVIVTILANTETPLPAPVRHPGATESDVTDASNDQGRRRASAALTSVRLE